MERTQDLGDLKSKHIPSKTFIYFASFILILLSALSAFIYFKGIVAVQEGKMNFSGDISILYWCIAFIMGFAVIILITAFALSKGKTFYLYERGIITEDGGDKKMQLFKDIKDVYLFSSGRTFIINNIAFRSAENNDWEVITVRYTKVLQAIQFITSQHKAINVPQQLKQLQSGGNVTFKYISYGTSAAKKLFATGIKSFLKVDAKDIIVHHDHLLIDSKRIMISDLSRFSTNNWINEISLYNKENNIVFSTATNGVFSSQTFIALLDELINQKH